MFDPGSGRDEDSYRNKSLLILYLNRYERSETLHASSITRSSARSKITLYPDIHFGRLTQPQNSGNATRCAKLTTTRSKDNLISFSVFRVQIPMKRTCSRKSVRALLSFIFMEFSFLLWPGTTDWLTFWISQIVLKKQRSRLSEAHSGKSFRV